ncbi:branched-chain amino acid transporter permease [Streptomyces sp. NPDC054796]|uniref:AzlD domain-containing protein n=1 Tax=Streptomyces daliensis TaxID=299421 RepID=A0A8T4IU33_9ACTN|nr:AzlD domain-containing protein [Streptomyces daliensis]
MHGDAYLLAAVGVAAAVTWALRALPFALLAPLRGSGAVHYLSAHMPVGVMVVLAVYSLHDAELTTAPYGAPLLLALAATVGLHLWKRNAGLSILGGTAFHVLLASVVFAG